MRSKISKTSISLICLMLVASSAEAGYKSSSYRSSYKSSFRPSSITRVEHLFNQSPGEPHG
ncbi:Uncharacterised protein [Klebsiella pneumoniae subsp. rhinoscleromatis]|nr:Uncharacterised protein [Klebsiella pneumoniae subsp. rhinoscleromatis]